MPSKNMPPSTLRKLLSPRIISSTAHMPSEMRLTSEKACCRVAVCANLDSTVKTAHPTSGAFGLWKSVRSPCSFSQNARIRLVVCPMLWAKCTSKDLPGQQTFGDKTQDDVCTLAIDVILPRADFFVLQHHIECEATKEDED